MVSESNHLSHDRVRRHTGHSSQSAIDESTRNNVRRYGALSRRQIDDRLTELDQQWDMERVLGFNAATLALSGAVLGLTVDRKWFGLTSAVLGFLAQHATMGWCPPVPVFRSIGIRTRSEINQEKYALKALRGDFEQVAEGPVAPERIVAAVRA
jgi:hypothetical protein